MLLSTVTAINPEGVSRVFAMEASEDNASIVQIEGLGPVKANVLTTDYAGLSGAHYDGSRRPVRNILITLELSPELGSESTQNVRDDLYQYFMTGEEVTLKFTLFDRFQQDLAKQELVVFTNGVVESFEGALFTANPTVVVSILCPDPDFVEEDEVVIEGEFDNSDYDDHTIEYEGTAPTGIIVDVEFDRSESSIRLRHNEPGPPIRDFAVAADFDIGDRLVVNTIPKERNLTRYDGPTVLSAIKNATEQIQWFALKRGTNIFGIRGDEAGTSIPYTIRYTRRYGGL